MTPAANPVNALCSMGFSLFFIIKKEPMDEIPLPLALSLSHTHFFTLPQPLQHHRCSFSSILNDLPGSYLDMAQSYRFRHVL